MPIEMSKEYMTENLYKAACICLHTKEMPESYVVNVISSHLIKVAFRWNDRSKLPLNFKEVTINLDDFQKMHRKLINKCFEIIKAHK